MAVRVGPRRPCAFSGLCLVWTLASLILPLILMTGGGRIWSGLFHHLRRQSWKDWQGKPVSPHDIKISRRGGARVPLLKTRLRQDKDTFETRWPQNWYSSRPIETLWIIKFSRPVCVTIRTCLRRAGIKIFRGVVDYQVFRTCVTIRMRSRRAGLKIFRGVVVTTYSRPVCDTFGTSWPQDMSRIIKYSRPICAAIRTRSRRAGLKIDIP